MKKHYEGLTNRMLSEIETISDEMTHQGEKGRNNEFVLMEFLERYLPKRYSVSTGKVVSAGGQESGQMDLIIHDRLNTPAFKDARAFRWVPVESVYAVISVKTALDRGQLQDALSSVESVRSLPRTAAMLHVHGGVVEVPEDKLLRPRGLVFAFKSSWASLDGANKAFGELLDQLDDRYRPNGVCILDQGLIIRKAFTTERLLFSEYVLMHFFVFLVHLMDSFPQYHLDLSKYFTENYGG